MVAMVKHLRRCKWRHCRFTQAMPSHLLIYTLNGMIHLLYAAESVCVATVSEVYKSGYQQ